MDAAVLVREAAAVSEQVTVKLQIDLVDDGKSSPDTLPGPEGFISSHSASGHTL